MGVLPDDLLEMDDDGSWLATLIEVHNNAHSDNTGVPLR